MRAALSRWSSALRSRWTTAVRSDRGSQAVAAVMIFPLVIMLIFAVLQGAFYFHARNAAQHAANAAVQAARIDGATNADGRAAANARIEAAGADLLMNPSVSMSRSAGTVTVTVRARVDSMIPGISDWRVTQTAAGAVERFNPASGS